MNYYEHHIGDYDADTAHLTWAEDMAYTRLLRLYYRKERPIPSDLNEACRLIRATSKDQRAAVEAVLQEFFRLDSDGWHQKRCDTDIAAYQQRAEHNRRVGKLGGRPRKPTTQTEPENNPVGLIREPEQNPPQTPDPSPHKNPLTPKGAEYEPEGFREFWSTWPKSHRKGGKDKCLDFWKRSKLEADAPAILAHVSLMASSKDWTKEGGQYVPAPIVYLRSARWTGAEVDPADSSFEGVV